jgi:ubiquinone/menaquinone biosynthesis C-methylase UbiE
MPETEDRASPRGLKLLPRSALVKTGNVDQADWNYRPVLGSIQRVRFRLITSLLPDAGASRLLELGYGSGVFLPELARHCTELCGVDVHRRNQEVMDILARSGVRAQLHVAGAETLPFDAHIMDVVVAVSSLEFMHDLDAACREVRRVLRPTGCFVVVTPGRSALVDMGVKLLTGTSARTEFGSRRDQVLPTLRRHFRVERHLHYPPFGGSWLRLYDALQLTP